MDKSSLVSSERSLAFNKATVISKDVLKKVSGGSFLSTGGYSTKESVDNMGTWDVGGDRSFDM